MQAAIFFFTVYRFERFTSYEFIQIYLVTNLVSIHLIYMWKATKMSYILNIPNSISVFTYWIVIALIFYTSSVVYERAMVLGCTILYNQNLSFFHICNVQYEYH